MSRRSPNPRVALAHDYLTQRGGAERVVLALARAFPGAPITSALYEPAGTYPEFASLDVRPLSLNRVGVFRAHHRLAFFALASAFGRAKVDADVVICSSSGWAHGLRTDGRKIVYCHAPARWLYQTERYAPRRFSLQRLAVVATRRPLLRWDRRAAASADTYVVNSNAVRKMVADAYGLDAEVVHPPVAPLPPASRDHQGPRGLTAGYVLVVSRLLPYKNVDRVVAAFDRRRGDRLVVVGDGPQRAALQASAGPGVVFLERVSDAELAWLYGNARALVGASYEDFGLTPIEAAAHGAPTVALRAGGYLDTVIEGETGVFFDEPTPAAIAAAIDAVDAAGISAETMRRHAGRFSEAAFAARMRAIAGIS
jgi:glycosyltransferase involved in cell wall biosynthesis